MNTRLGDAIFASIAAVLISVPVLHTCGCSGSPEGETTISSVAAGASDAAVVAARECLASLDCTREDALRAAEDAAVAYVLARVPDAVDAQYRPYINAALLLIDLGMAKSPVVSAQPIRKAVEDAVIEAEIAKGIKVNFGSAR